MEIIRDIGLGVSSIEEKLLPRNIGPDEDPKIKVPDEEWIEGGKMIGVGRWALLEELQKQTYVFDREGDKYHEDRERTGIEFPKNIWEMSNEEGVSYFGGNKHYIDLEESTDFGISILSNDPPRLEQYISYKKEVSIKRSYNMLRMVEKINGGYQIWDGKAEGEEGLAHGGMKFPKDPKILRMQVFNHTNKGKPDDLELLPQFVEKNCLRKIKKIHE